MKRKVEWGRHHFMDILDENSIVFDIGANTGEVTQFILDKYNCNMSLYEPNRYLIDGLKNRFKQYKNVTINNILISHIISKDIQFYIDEIDTLSSIFKHDTMKSIKDVISINSTTIEEEMKKYNKDIDLIKLDVEGMEYQILKHMKPEVMRRIKQFHVEYHMYANQFPGVDRIHKKFENNGFKHIVYDNLKDHLYIRNDLI